MPFVSESQRKWMFANKPGMAKEWAAHTPKNSKLPEKVKHAYVMYSSALEELAKIAATVLQQPLRPEQHAQWQAYQAASGPAPSQATVQAMRPVQQQTQRMMSDLPLVGGFGESYDEALPQNMRGRPSIGNATHQQAMRHAASNRKNALTRRLQESGRVFHTQAGVEQQLASMPSVNTPGTPVQLYSPGKAYSAAPARSGFRVQTSSLQGHEATQLAATHAPEAFADTQIGGLSSPAQAARSTPKTLVERSTPKTLVERAIPQTQVAKAIPRTLISPIPGIAKTAPKLGVLGKLKGVGGKLLKAAA